MWKRIISCLLVVAISLTSLPSSLFAETNTPVEYGDINSDARIDENDYYALKHYLAEEKVEGFQEANADVNNDGVVDLKDLLRLKKHLEDENIHLGPDVCRVSFYDGDRLIDVLTTDYDQPLGQVPAVEKSSKENAILMGYYLDEACTQPFYAADPVQHDMKVYAKYQEMDDVETLNITSFAQMDQEPDLSFEIKKISGNAAIDQAFTLITKDGSEAVAMTWEEKDGIYTIHAIDGFQEGCSYELTLAEGWIFEGKEETIRTASFTIRMDEVENLQMNEDIFYIQDTDEIDYTVEGEVLEILSSKDITENGGSFEYENAGQLKEGNVICLYVGVKPTERDVSDGAELMDPAVYVKVTKIDDKLVTFAALEQEDQQTLYHMPDNFPMKVKELPDGEIGTTGTVNFECLDEEFYALMMGEEDGTREQALAKIEIGDFVTLYLTSDSLESQECVRYGKITAYNKNTGNLTYELTTYDAIIESMNLYAETTVSGEDLISEEEKVTLEEQLYEQVEASGFAEDAADLLADVVTSSEEFSEKVQIERFMATDAKGNSLNQSQVRAMNLGTSMELSDEVKLKVQLITGGEQLHFGDGVQLAIGVEASYEAEVEDGKVAIELSATFVQEVSLKPTFRGKLVTKKVLWIPIPIGVEVSASIDIKSYTALSIAARVYTVKEEEKNTWEKFKDIVNDPKELLGLENLPEGLSKGLSTVSDAIKKVEELQSKIDEAKETVDKINGYKEDIEALWDAIEQTTEGGTDEITKEKWEEMGTALGKTNIASELLDMMNLTTDTDLKTEYLDSMQALMERYQELLEKESSWIQLVNQEIFSYEYCIYGLCVGVQVNFVVRADVNIALGTNLEYEVGKRYTFWFRIGLFTPSAGSSSMDLIDERFAFQFYVMGKLGVKAGVRAKIYIGIGSGKFASAGIAAEIGPYVKLYGFFVYEYSKYRPANTQDWTYAQRMAGALYLDFGMYFLLSFEANAIGNLFEYSYDFIDKEISLLKAGERRYYYGCTYEAEEDEVLLIEDEDGNSTNGITMRVPDGYWALNYVDLDTGVLGNEKLDYSKYNVTLSNPNFTLDKNTGTISVSVPENIRYMECDMTVTYLGHKLAFSQWDMSTTIPLVWTNLSTEELKQYYTVSVRVGNSTDGYQTIWSKRVRKNQEFDLPDTEKVLELVGYHALRFDSIGGYATDHITGLSVIEDKVYDFDATFRKYSLTVDGIQNEDGSTYKKVFTAKYGETFDFSSLANTGTAVEGTAYTAFAGVTADGIDLTQPINSKTAEILLSGTAAATAIYEDDSVKATFAFTGIDREDIVQTIRKGTEPEVNPILDIVAEQGLQVMSMNPMVSSQNTNATYQVVCGALIGPEATITFEENGGSTVSDITKVEGSLIGSIPQPVKTGYTFDGWYIDRDSLRNRFAAKFVPQGGITVYAKWTAGEYPVNLNVNGGNETYDPLIVTYDKTYGELPTPTRSGYGFDGWYTQPEGGVKITEQTKVQITEEQTLYAHWNLLKDISADVFDFGELESFIYATKTEREAGYDFLPEEGESYTADSFTYTYMLQGSSEPISGLPVDGGTYDILISREADNKYKRFEHLYMGVLRIDYISYDVDACWYSLKVRDAVKSKLGSSADLDIEIAWEDGSKTTARHEINYKWYERSYAHETAPTSFYCKSTSNLDRTFQLEIYVSDLAGNSRRLVDYEKYFAASKAQYSTSFSGFPTVDLSEAQLQVDSCSKIWVDLATYGVNDKLSNLTYRSTNDAVTVKGERLLIDGSKLSEGTNEIAVYALNSGGNQVYLRTLWVTRIEV